jgi:beta-ribofuranosylaminobenzene 5'-phosphate synthase
MPTIKLHGFPRLHLGLLDVGNATARRYGGCGFALDFPAPLIEAEANDSTELVGFEPIDQRARAGILDALQHLVADYPKATARLHLIDCPPQHIGLGTTTCLTLAALVATCLAAGLKVNRPVLQRLSGRGATSGIGINSFFSGGFIVDDGHDARFDPRHLPSSISRPHDTPSINTRVRVPDDWRFALLVAPGRRIHGKPELEFFQSHTPIPRDEAAECIATTYHGIVPAFRYGCMNTLGNSLRRFHEIGLKARELQTQNESVRALYDRLKAMPEMAVGVSSLGPVLFVAHRRGDKRLDGVLAAAADYGASVLGVFGGRNAGYYTRVVERVKSTTGSDR